MEYLVVAKVVKLIENHTSSIHHAMCCCVILLRQVEEQYMIDQFLQLKY